MLIVSDFHDYYDSVLSLGIDKQCPYQRKQQKVEIRFPRETISPSSLNEYVRGGFKYKIKYRLIGFCGHIFPVVTVEKYGLFGQGVVDQEFFYQEKPLVHYLESLKITPKQYKRWWQDRYTIEVVDGLKNFFNPMSWNHFLHYFQDHKVPIFLIGYDFYILNPELKKYRFQQVKDPYTAFQEVYMYVSGVLGVQPKPTVEISDEDKAEAKGHGGKYSFRKPPGKRGKNRWR